MANDSHKRLEWPATGETVFAFHAPGIQTALIEGIKKVLLRNPPYNRLFHNRQKGIYTISLDGSQTDVVEQVEKLLNARSISLHAFREYNYVPYSEIMATLPKEFGDWTPNEKNWGEPLHELMDRGYDGA